MKELSISKFPLNFSHPKNWRQVIKNAFLQPETMSIAEECWPEFADFIKKNQNTFFPIDEKINSLNEIIKRSAC